VAPAAATAATPAAAAARRQYSQMHNRPSASQPYVCRTWGLALQPARSTGEHTCHVVYMHMPQMLLLPRPLLPLHCAAQHVLQGHLAVWGSENQTSVMLQAQSGTLLLRCSCLIVSTPPRGWPPNEGTCGHRCTPHGCRLQRLAKAHPGAALRGTRYGALQPANCARCAVHFRDARCTAAACLEQLVACPAA
jgi:hypothetical protein